MADDEYHAFERTVAQYDKWRNLILDWIQGKSNGDVGAGKRFGPIEAKLHLPPEEAVHASLRRHLPGYIAIDSIEPVGYRSVGDAEELEYRVTVESPVNVYVVPALAAAPPPDNAPELVKQVWPDLLWDATLPPGMHFGADRQDNPYLLVKADQKFSFVWKIEEAAIVDGKWKILRVSPPLLEWNPGFLAAGLDAALQGGATPLFLCQGKDLPGYIASYNQCLDEVKRRYDFMEADIAKAKDDLQHEVTKAPGKVSNRIDMAAVKQARSNGFNEGAGKGQEFSDNVLSNAEGTTGLNIVPAAEGLVPIVAG